MLPWLSLILAQSPDLNEPSRLRNDVWRTTPDVWPFFFFLAFIGILFLVLDQVRRQGMDRQTRQEREIEELAQKYKHPRPGDPERESEQQGAKRGDEEKKQVAIAEH
jgi:hypothetical protein